MRFPPGQGLSSWVFRDTPIIFLTAIVSNEETDGHEMISGDETFLAKLVDTKELLKCIKQILLSPVQLQHHAFSLHL